MKPKQLLLSLLALLASINAYSSTYSRDVLGTTMTIEDLSELSNNKQYLIHTRGKIRGTLGVINNHLASNNPTATGPWVCRPVVLDTDNPLITHVSQLSSPYTEPTEGSLAAMIDGRVNTFWHSKWSSGNVQAGKHFFQVEMEYSTNINVAFQVTRRQADNDHITEWGVYGTDAENASKEECTLLANIETPYTFKGETRVSDIFSTGGYRYIRFYIENTSTGNGFGHLAEFQLYPATFDETRDASPFAIIKKDDNFYLYSVRDKAFITPANNGNESTYPSSKVNIYEHNDYFVFDFILTGYTINVNDYGVAIDNYGTSNNMFDDGNLFTIEEVGDFDPAEALAMFEGNGEGTEAINFADANVKEVCVNNWDINSDGELNFWEAAAVTDLGTVFKNNNIEYFNELQYFTGLTSIGASAFLYSHLTSITIPNGVTSIGGSAFQYCSNLTSVTIPNSVTSIGDNAFRNCDFLTSITIPNGVTSIGDYAFKDCGLRSITIPEGATIGSYAFADCDDLTDVTLPGAITFDGEDAFTNDHIRSVFITDLTKWLDTSFPSGNNPLRKGAKLYLNNVEVKDLVIPEGTTTILTAAFEGYQSLTSVTIPNSVTSINGWAFASCSNLTSVTIAESVTTIGEYAFSYCSSLTDVWCYAESIPTTGTNLFYSIYSTNISSATLHVPSSSLGVYSTTEPWSKFGRIETIENSPVIIFDDANVKDYCVANWDKNKDRELSEAEAAAVTDLGNVFKGNTEITSFNELQYFTGLTSIGYEAFKGCSSLTSINIPDGVTSIEDRAFSGCSSLTSINIPDGVTDIWNYAFAGCSSLTSINIPDGVTSIGYEAFSGCSSLTSINIPDGVTDIWDYAFSGCSSLTSINIPDGVTSIADGVFGGCRSLTSITIPDGVTSIGDEAFCDCFGLTSITIPNNVTSIGEFAFSHCSNLTSINIPDGVTSIAGGVFGGCRSLTSITIPDGVTSIGNEAFCDCSGLISITIPNSVTSIGWSAFAGCSSLTSITIPYDVTSIDNDNPSFYRCYFTFDSFINNSSLTDDDYWGATLCDEETTEGLLIKNNAIVKCRPWATSVTIPEGVTSIEESAFNECSGLTSVTIPNSVTSIGNGAFSGCSLADVYCEAELIPETNSNPFWSKIFPYATLHVPAASLEAYSTTEPWSNFSTIAAIGDNRMSQTLSLESLPQMTYGDDAYTLLATTNEGLTLTWTTNDAAIATISGNELTINGAGTTTIIANQAGNDTYLPIHRSYTLTVQKALLTITAIDCSKMQGTENPELTVIYNGFKYNDDASVLTTPPTVFTTANTNSPAGPYPIIVSRAEAANYYFKYVNGTLTVIQEITNSITCPYFIASSGQEIELPIQLTNKPDLAIVGIQFTLMLPEGVTFKKGTNNNPVYELTDSRLDPDDFSVTQVLHSDNLVGVSISATSPTAVLQGSEGTFMTFTLNIAEDMETGGLIRFTGNQLSIKNSDSSVSTVLVSDVSCPFSITDDGNGGGEGGHSNVIMGDVNNDGEVDLSDAIMVIYYSLHVIPDIFIIDAADLNYDGDIDLSDAITIIYMSLGIQSTNNAKRPSKAAARNNDCLQLSGEGNSFCMSLSNEERYLGFQCDIILPEGTTLSSVALSDSRAESHSLMFNQLEDGSYRIAVFSAYGDVFFGNAGELLTFNTEGTAQGEVSIKNIFFVNTHMEKCVFDDLSAIATGIHSPFADNSNEPVYDLSGRKVANNKLPMGIYVSKNKKMVRK